MEKILKNILTDGTMTRTSSMVYGMYKGYYTTIKKDVNLLQKNLKNRDKIYFVIRMNHEIKIPDDTNRKAFNDIIVLELVEHFGNVDRNKNIVSALAEDYFIEVRLLASASVQVINRIVNNMVEFLNEYAAHSGCQLCGSQSVDGYSINGWPGYYCFDCYSKLVRDQLIKQRSTFNPILGLIGAVAGALPGFAIWLIFANIKYIGSIRWLGGLGILLGAIKGYEYLSKKPDKKGLVMAIAVAAIMVFSANKLSFILLISKIAKEIGYYFSVAEINTHWRLFMDDKIWFYYYSRLIAGYAIAGGVGIYDIINAFQRADGIHPLKKGKV